MADLSYHRIRYSRDSELESLCKYIASTLGWEHIVHERLAVIRSTGTKSKRILARCHALSRVFQKALGTDAHYVIEILTENFDRLPQEEKVKTLIHELMHIPKSFAGGFRHHNVVNRRSVEKVYREYLNRNSNL